jgi:enoyl-CoA hydratase
VSEITNSSDLLQRAIEIGDTILEAPSDTIKYIKSYFISNTEKGFEESFLVEHDKAFQDILLPKAKNGLSLRNGRG